MLITVKSWKENSFSIFLQIYLVFAVFFPTYYSAFHIKLFWIERSEIMPFLMTVESLRPTLPDRKASNGLLYV